MEPLKKPVVNFFKAFPSYNGCIEKETEEYHSEEGIHSTSRLSGAQVSTEAVVEVHPNSKSPLSREPEQIESSQPPIL